MYKRTSAKATNTINILYKHSMQRIWHLWGGSDTNCHSFFIQFAYTSLGFIQLFWNVFFLNLSTISFMSFSTFCMHSNSFTLSLFICFHILKSIILTNVHWSKKSINCLVASFICRNAQTNTHIYPLIVLCSAIVLCALNYSL